MVSLHVSGKVHWSHPFPMFHENDEDRKASVVWFMSLGGET